MSKHRRDIPVPDRGTDAESQAYCVAVLCRTLVCPQHTPDDYAFERASQITPGYSR